MDTKEFNRCLRSIANANGNKRGMEKFYNCFYGKIKWSAVSEGIGEENAKDVASKVMVDIFSHAAGYGYVKNTKAWMYKVTKNAIVNFKKQNAKYVYTELIDETFSAKDANLDFKIEFCNRVNALPPREQEVVRLHFIFGFKIKEVAKFLNISTSTVNRDIASVREELKDLYEKLKK